MSMLNKALKWGLIAAAVAGCIGGGFAAFAALTAMHAGGSAVVSTIVGTFAMEGVTTIGSVALMSLASGGLFAAIGGAAGAAAGAIAHMVSGETAHAAAEESSVSTRRSNVGRIGHQPIIDLNEPASSRWADFVAEQARGPRVR